jgi:exodeoxyribonuclease-3
VSAPDRRYAGAIEGEAGRGTGLSVNRRVIVALGEAPEGYIGPVVPPPAAPAACRRSVKLPQAR